MHDTALLLAYAESHSENAFAELVKRYLPLVYGAALRRVGGDTHLAEDVAQMVFTALSRDARRLAQHPNLAGWLFTTTRYLAAKAVRTERRRQSRERMAADDTSAAESADETLAQLRPVLDEVIMELRELDRQMLLLRFFRGLRLAEIAAQLNSSENAVQKRIERALERLNALLSRRGITSTGAALAFALEQHAAVSVPAGLTAAATTAGLAGGAGGLGGGMVATGSGLFGLTNVQLVTVAVALGIGSVGVIWYQRENARLRQELATARAAPPLATISEEPARPVATAEARTPQVPTSPPARTVPAPAPAAAPAFQEVPAATSVVPPAPAAVGTGEGLVPLEIEYPRPLFAGTPRPIQIANLEIVTPGRRPHFMVPRGTVLLSRRKPVTSSDSLPVIGELAFVTDGDKTGTDGAYVELGPGRQWIQIDLGATARVAAIVVWHFHSQSRVYHDVIVQISDDKDFRKGVSTVFNNDHDNSSKLGRGRDRAYIETHQGKILDARATRGRYVRLYSNGNTSDELNHYCEVEVYGRQATGD